VSLPSPSDSPAAGRRLPKWLRVNLPAGDAGRIYAGTATAVSSLELHTVCQEARCPNIHDCWARGTATFMIAGKECTRGCRFCAVQTARTPAPPDPDEPKRLASAVARMRLKHVVITVVNRDDLPDGGAGHYRRCVDAVHDRVPRVGLELLCSDLGGSNDALACLLDGLPLQVFAHNVECVPRLDALVRDPRASFDQSLKVLESSKRLRADVFTKSSIMVGLGESEAEVFQSMRQLRDVHVDMITLGQYIAPGRQQMPVARYVTPDQFQTWRAEALRLGFKAAACGPMVRSSYRAGRLLQEARRVAHAELRHPKKASGDRDQHGPLRGTPAEPA